MYGSKRPLKEHIPCSNKGCNNYYNSTYKNTNSLCVPCNKSKKEKNE